MGVRAITGKSDLSAPCPNLINAFCARTIGAETMYPEIPQEDQGQIRDGREVHAELRRPGAPGPVAHVPIIRSGSYLNFPLRCWRSRLFSQGASKISPSVIRLTCSLTCHGFV